MRGATVLEGFGVLDVADSKIVAPHTDLFIFRYKNDIERWCIGSFRKTSEPRHPSSGKGEKRLLVLNEVDSERQRSG